MSDKWLYIPVEIKVREIPAKILLAAVAARNGYKVILGRKAEISKYINSFPAGIFLGFGAQKNFTKEYSNLKKNGFAVAIMDEEGLVTFSDDIYKRLRLSDDTLNESALFLAWGKKQSNILNQAPCPVYETGNVRFDILRPEFRHLLEKEVQSINERFGKTILINSSFGSCNHFDGKERYFTALKEKKIIQNKEDAKFYKRYFELKENVFRAYMEAIPEIAKEFPDHTIIVRPHPSEDYDAWKDAARGADNVVIVHEGSIHPWLIACDAVIHHFCTTALEAFVSDTASIGYRPFRDDKIENDLTYRGSLPAETQKELMTALHKIVDGEIEDLQKIRKQQRPALKEHIENIEGPFAFENILKAFDRHAITTSTKISMCKVHMRKGRTLLGNLYRFLKRGMRPYQKNYMDHKFSSLGKEEIESIISDIGKTVPGLENIKIKKIDKFCFLITGS